MPEGNELVAAPEETTTAVTGIGIAESAQGLASGISNGDWVEAGLSAAGVGLEVLSMVIDPLGTLASYGVSWLIEHVQPLKEALDWFAGDPPVIQSFSQTWGNVAAEVTAVAQEFLTEANAGTAGWTGQAADTYRGHSTEAADALQGAGTLAEGISVGVMIMGEVVAFVREFIRDMVGELVGRLIAWALELAATLGLATPAVVAQATAAISSVVSRVTEVVRKLVKTISNVAPRIRNVISKLDEIIAKLAKLMRRGDADAPSGTTTPNSTTTPSSTPSTTPSSTTPSSTTPSSTTPSSTTPSATPSTPDTSTTPSGTTRPDGTSPDSTSPSSAGSSPDRPGDPGSTRAPDDLRRTCNDPVDVVSGEVVLAQTDVELAGALPVVLRRVHVSSYRAGRGFGPSWASTMDQRLSVDDDGVVYVADDGMILVYPHPGNDVVLPRFGPQWPLRATEDGFRVSRGAELVDLRFTTVGDTAPLTEIVDRNGDHVRFTRTADGVVTDIRHSGGYHVRVDSADGRVAALWLTGDQEDDVLLVRYGYDRAGNLTEVVNSSQLALRFTYDHAGRLSQWTDRNGRWYRYLYDDHGRCVANQGDGGYLNGTFSYHPDLGETRFVDALGNTSVYQYNELRQIVAETDPLGGVVRREWDHRDQLLAETDALGRTTRYRYDDAGNLSGVTRADGSQIQARHNDAHQVTEVVEADGGVWLREYDERGNITAMTDPTGVVKRYGYDAHGYRASITDALDARYRIERNPVGLPTVLTDATGAVTRVAWDRFGRVATITDPVGGTTRYRWSVEGNLWALERPDGSVERWTYDGEGNQTSYVDPLGQVHQREVTHFDLAAGETRPDGTRSRFTYDANLRVVRLVDAPDRVWHYAYDAAGNRITETDPDGRKLRFRYDAAGQLVERITAAGQVTRYEYDQLGNIRRVDADGEVAEFAYDVMGRVSRARNADADVRFERDALGRVLAESIDGLTVRSSYDPLGRRTGVRTPSGRENTWRFDGNDRAVELRTAGQTMTLGLDQAGRELRRTFGQTTVTQSWDPVHRLTSQSVTRGGGQRQEIAQHRGYRYRADGRLLAVEDQLAGPRSFDLDLFGRVTAVRGPQWQEDYAYNEAGAVSAARWPGQDSDLHGPREYAGNAVTTAGGVRFVRDQQGRVVLRQRKRLSAKPATWRFTWTTSDRMAGVTTPDGTRYRYRYDAFGRRVGKQRLAEDGTVAHEVRFCWDGALLVEQVESDGRATGWDWDPVTARPLAQIERVRGADQEWIDAAFYAIVTDLVGAPSELFDQHGALAWRRSATLWGQVLSPPGPVSTPLRFPGQYYDPETGLHYNLQRYYDPVAGQYYSPDPVGAAAGENPYGYVSDPRRSIDPLGLAPCHLQDIRDYRTQQRVGMKRNIAFADYEIGTNTGRSNMAPSGGHQYPNAAPSPSNSPFTTNSPLDSEPKILNELINDLGLTPQSSGTIHFHSERPACPDCQGVIDQFKQMYPNIEIKYTDYGGAGPDHPTPQGRTVTY
ncbi:DUF6531 domain-containing protein [Actinophytocola sediminis]